MRGGDWLPDMTHERVACSSFTETYRIRLELVLIFNEKRHSDVRNDFSTMMQAQNIHFLVLTVVLVFVIFKGF
jgi:hypothetical protein